MVNNCTNINKMNNYLSLQIIEHKDLVLGLEHAHAVFLYFF
jgi:hypothetical protein